MRISTCVKLQMLPDLGLAFVSEEGFDYDGPLALLDRGQSTAAAKQSGQYGAADQAMADTTFQMGNTAIGAVNNEAGAKWIRDSQEFAPGGGFAQTMQGNETAATQGGKNSTDAYMQDYLHKTGGTPGTQSQVVASSEEAGRQNQRDMAAMGRQDELARLAGLDSANKDWINSKQQVAADIGGYYAPSVAGSTGQLGNETSAAKTPGFWDQFMNDAISAAGTVAGGYAGGKAACWIASELFGGWHDPRTILVREWLNGDFRKTLFGGIVMAIYLRIGKRVAGLIRRIPPLRYLFLPLFNRALDKARASRDGR